MLFNKQEIFLDIFPLLRKVETKLTASCQRKVPKLSVSGSKCLSADEAKERKGVSVWEYNCVCVTSG
jgi:hypothetical protein